MLFVGRFPEWSDQQLREKVHRVTFLFPLVKECVPEYALPRGQFVGCSTTAGEIGGGGTLARRLRRQLWHAGLEFRGSTLLINRKWRC